MQKFEWMPCDSFLRRRQVINLFAEDSPLTFLPFCGPHSIFACGENEGKAAWAEGKEGGPNVGPPGKGRRSPPATAEKEEEKRSAKKEER